ncbi:MAG: caspase family protein, partial [Treponema sp.]|nr:caspase family protein [Treponema sp.]
MPEIVVQEWHNGGSDYIFYCNNGKYIFSVSDSDVKLWDSKTGYLIRTFSDRIKYPKNARIAPDSSYFVYENEANNIEICDTKSRKTITIFNLFSIPSDQKATAKFAFSSDGNYLAMSYYDKIVIFEAHSLKRKYVLESTEFFYAGFEMEFSQDGTYLTTIAIPNSEDYQKQLGQFINVIWNVRKQSAEQILSAQKDRFVTAVAISKNGKYNALASAEGNVFIYDLQNKTLLNMFAAGSSGYFVNSMNFSPDENNLLTVDALGYVGLWNIQNGKQIARRTPTSLEQSMMYFGNAVIDSNQFAFTNYHGIEIRNLNNFNLLKTISQSSDMNTLSFNSKLGYLCAFKFGEGIPTIFDDNRFFKYDFPYISSNMVTAPELFENGIYYVKSDKNKNILKFYDIISRQEVDVMEVINCTNRYISADNSGHIVSYPSIEPKGTRVRVLDTTKKLQIMDLFLDGYYHTVKTSPCGKFVVVNDDNDKENLIQKDSIIINISSGFQKKFSGSRIESVSFSNDDTYCSICVNGNLIIYDTNSWKQISSYENGYFSAFSNDKKMIAVCTNKGKTPVVHIYSFSENNDIREIKTQSVRSLYFSNDAKKLICQDYGGIIRCYSVQTGELLSCTIANTTGDWLTYTPEGYFTGSPGGINKFVHLVDGMQVFELGQLYDTLYRPDLVQAKLEGKDIGKPVLKDIVATGDAPRVQFVGTPMATSRNIKLEFSVQDSGGGIGYVYLSQNGKTMQVSAGEESKTGRKFIYTCDVTLAAGENVFEAYAANSANKIESRHISVSLNWQGKVEKSNLYVLAMGVDKYTKMPKNNLRYSVADATAIIESFKTAPGGLYSSVNMMTLLDSDVNKANIENAFDVFSAKVKPDDMFVLHIAGHGVNYGGEYYYLPADTFAKTDADFAKQGISKHFLTENLSKLQALNMVVLLDTCYSGAFIDTNAKGNALAQQTALEHLQHTSGQVILTGASNTQTAGEGYNGHGIFTYAILEALSGKANYNADGAVSIKEITQYIGYEIPNIYEKMGFDRQSPWNSLIRGDFSLVAYGNKSPSLSKDVSLKDNKKDIVWVSKRIVEGSALFDSMAKKIDKSDDGVYKESDSYKLTKTASAEFFGKSKEIKFNAGYSKGTIFEGLSLGAGFYFFGNQHIFAGVGCDFIFSSLIGKYEDETDVQKMTFANMNAIFGLSANIGHFRPFVQTGFGGYVVSVPDSNTDTSVFSFSAHGAVGSDI